MGEGHVLQNVRLHLEIPLIEIARAAGSGVGEEKVLLTFGRREVRPRGDAVFAILEADAEIDLFCVPRKDACDAVHEAGNHRLLEDRVEDPVTDEIVVFRRREGAAVRPELARCEEVHRNAVREGVAAG